MRWLDNLRQSIGLLGRPARCIHVGDRESDIFELYCLTRDLGTHFIVRRQTDRLAGDGDHTVSEEMDEVAIKGLHGVEIHDEKGGSISVTLELRTKRIHILPPIGKQSRYPALNLTVIHATERGAPKGRKPIEWKLTTDLPASTRSEVVERIDWYALRWKIEVFHLCPRFSCVAMCRRV